MRRRTVVATITAAATLSGVGGFMFAGAEATCVTAPGAGGRESAGRRICISDTGVPGVDVPRLPRLPYVPGGPGEVEPADPTRTVRGIANRGIDAGNGALADVWDAAQILGGSTPIGPIPLPRRPEVPHV